MSHVSARDWDLFVSTLQEIEKVLPVFLSPDQYAKRWGGKMSQQKIKDDLVKGKIPKRLAVKKQFGKKGRFKALINWDLTVDSYALNLAPELRPSGFDSKKKFRPIGGGDWSPLLPHEADIASQDTGVRDKKLNIGNIRSLEDAKLQVEKLKILKMQSEIMMSNNKTILIQDVKVAVASWGVEIRGAWMSVKNRMKNDLANCNTPQGCDKILENGFSEVWDVLKSPPSISNVTK